MSEPQEARRTEAVGRAGGKVILLGEHAVVYGAPGLAAGLDRGAAARARLAEGAESTLHLGDAVVTADPHATAPELARALAALLHAGGGHAQALAIDAVAELPPGGGLGCSAALGVAIARAVERALDPDAPHAPNATAVLARASAWEAIFHGNPSGIDTAAALGGGVLRYVRGEGATPLATIYDLHLAVAHSGRGASTRAMVERVAARRAERPAEVEAFLGAVTALVDEATRAIARGDARALGRALDENHARLRALSLSTEALDALTEAARAGGALGAKLTGSGGGGAMIALAGATRQGDAGASADARALAASLVERFDALGFPAFSTCIRANEPER